MGTMRPLVISPQNHVVFDDMLSTVMSSTAAYPEVWIRLVTSIFICLSVILVERLTWTFLPKASPLGDVTYWYSVPSGLTLSIDTGIYWLLAL